MDREKYESGNENFELVSWNHKNMYEGERIEAAYVPRLSRKNGIPFFVTDNRDLPLYYVYLRETGD